MSEMKIVTEKEIEELVKKLYDGYYQGIDRQMRKEFPMKEERDEQIAYILQSAYAQLKNVNWDSKEELDEKALPIINREIEKRLLPLKIKRCMEKKEMPVMEFPQFVLKEDNDFTDIKVDDEEAPSAEVEDTQVEEQEEQVEFEEPKRLGVNRTIEPVNLKRKPKNRIWLSIGLSILCTLLTWLIVGFLMSNRIIPRVDFGYVWFNTHIWKIF